MLLVLLVMTAIVVIMLWSLIISTTNLNVEDIDDLITPLQNGTLYKNFVHAALLLLHTA